MTQIPKLHPQDLPRILHELTDLLESRSAFLRGVREGRLPGDADTLRGVAQTYCTLLSSLDDLAPCLNTLSLEPLSETQGAQLEDVFLRLGEVRGVIQGVLSEVGRRAAPHHTTPTLTLEPLVPGETRFPGDWVLPPQGVLLAVWWVSLPHLEPPPIPGAHLYRGGDFLGVAYRLRGDPLGVQRVSSRFRHARGEDRRLAHAPWMDGEKAGSVEEVIRSFSQVVELLAQQASQAVTFQKVRVGGADLRRLLEREGPRWGAFVSG